MILVRIELLVEIIGFRGEDGFAIPADDCFFDHIITGVAAAENAFRQFVDREVGADDTAKFSVQIGDRNGTRDAESRYGIEIPAEGVVVGLQSEFEPPYSAGKYSSLNCRKLIVIHKDEPKVPREFERIIKDYHANPL